jgi:hypothetical protein
MEPTAHMERKDLWEAPAVKVLPVSGLLARLRVELFLVIGSAQQLVAFSRAIWLYLTLSFIPSHSSATLRRGRGTWS